MEECRKRKLTAANVRPDRTGKRTGTITFVGVTESKNHTSVAVPEHREPFIKVSRELWNRKTADRPQQGGKPSVEGRGEKNKAPRNRNGVCVLAGAPEVPEGIYKSKFLEVSSNRTGGLCGKKSREEKDQIKGNCVKVT